MTLQALERSRTTSVDYCYATSVGMVRETNQDGATAVALPNVPMGHTVLMVVADGMGGHEGGEIASGLCVNTVVSHLKSVASQLDSWQSVRNALHEALRLAQSSIRAYAARENSDLGTTATVAFYCAGEVEIAHVGDSRAYVIAGGGIRQITDDDSWVAQQVRRGSLTEEEAAASSQRNVLTQALGSSRDVSVHCYHESLPARSCLLLCSDGLHGVVDSPSIRRIVSRSTNAKTASDRLVNAANAGGGQDNITAVTLYVGGGPNLGSHTMPINVRRRSSRFRARRKLVALAGALCVMLGVLVGGYIHTCTRGIETSAPISFVVRVTGRTLEVTCPKSIKCTAFYRGIRVAQRGFTAGAKSDVYIFVARRSVLAPKEPVALKVTLEDGNGKTEGGSAELAWTKSGATLQKIAGADGLSIVLSMPGRDMQGVKRPAENGASVVEPNAIASGTNAGNVNLPRASAKPNPEGRGVKPTPGTSKTPPGSIKPPPAAGTAISNAKIELSRAESARAEAQKDFDASEKYLDGCEKRLESAKINKFYDGNELGRTNAIGGYRGAIKSAAEKRDKCEARRDKADVSVGQRRDELAALRVAGGKDE